MQTMNFRSTPIWPVGAEAQNAEATPRVIELANHKNVHQDYKYMRSGMSEDRESYIN